MRLEHISDAEIFSIANPIMDNLMDASTAIDHERHIRDFTDRMKSIVTKERQTTHHVCWAAWSYEPLVSPVSEDRASRRDDGSAHCPGPRPCRCRSRRTDLAHQNCRSRAPGPVVLIC